MKIIRGIPVLLAVVFSVFFHGEIAGATSGATAASSPTGNPIFDEEFNGTSLDSSTWIALNRPGDSSNGEAQCYLPSNAAVADGSLVLTSKVDGSCAGYSYTSAMVQWKSFNFLYGTIEIRAKEAGGQGTWPALWLLGADCQQANITTADNVGTCNWPAPGSDEIDIAEIKGGNLTTVNQNLISNGTNTTCAPTTSDVSQNWHTYDLIWQPGSLTWQIDGQTTCTMTQAVPAHPMFLLLNTALGGNGGGQIDASTLPQTHSIDYVRVYQPAGSATATPTATATPVASATTTTMPTATSTTPPSNPTPLVGASTIQSSLDSNGSGQAEAFPFVATGTGTSAGVSLYLDSANTASEVTIGVYSSTAGSAGTLLGQVTINSPKAGAWNRAPLSVGITAGTTYWLVILEPAGSTGSLWFRDTNGGTSSTSAQTGLTTLPATWAPGSNWPTINLSAYLS